MNPLSAPREFHGSFRSDELARAVYSEAAGVAREWPRAVAVPLTTQAVVTLVRWANATQQPLIARGSGTSMAGGAVGDGVIVDLSRLRDCADIAPLSGARLRGLAAAATHSVIVGPGVLRGEVDDAARTLGLRFPVDPSSGAYCTVGGMAATNAAGPHSLSRGPMRDWVVGLECVFADATRAWIRRGAPLPELPAVQRLVAWGAEHGERAERRSTRAVRKDSSGYAIGAWRASGELVDLLVGSEGTMALFTAIEVALEPRPPSSATMLAAFASLDQAAAAALAASGAGAATCELLDRTLLDLARGGARAVPVPDGTDAVLLSAIEGDDAFVADVGIRRLRATFEAHGATEVTLGATPDDEHALWEWRHAASPMLAALDPSIASVQVIEDGCVPPPQLAAYVRGVREALIRQRLRGVIFGHAGDAHMHVNPLVDVRDGDWRARLEALVAEVAALTARLGGTLAGEHGDGRLRAPLNTAVRGADAMTAWAGIKRAADPESLLNPGVIVPVEAQQALGKIKYDPALPPLPAAARDALDEVRRTRGYAQPRLELVDAHSAR